MEYVHLWENLTFLKRARPFLLLTDAFSQLDGGFFCVTIGFFLPVEWISFQLGRMAIRPYGRRLVVY